MRTAAKHFWDIVACVAAFQHRQLSCCTRCKSTGVKKSKEGRHNIVSAFLTYTPLTTEWHHALALSEIVWLQFSIIRLSYKSSSILIFLFIYWAPPPAASSTPVRWSIFYPSLFIFHPHNLCSPNCERSGVNIKDMPAETQQSKQSKNTEK